MIPLPFVQPKAGCPVFTMNLNSLDQLLPGAHRGLDVICDGILGTPLIYDE